MDREREYTPRQPEPQQRQPEQQQTAPRQPADTIRDGNLKASIWRNEGENSAFYAATFSRTYRDAEGQYRDSHSFGAGDLLKLSELARTAYTRTNELRRDDRAQARDPQESEGTRREAFRTERRDRGVSKSPQYKR